MKRVKTIKVDDLRIQVNKQLLNSKDSDIGGRKALIQLIEKNLMGTGNYNGFNYLGEKEMQKSEFGTSIGIRPATEKDRWNNTDFTRIQYF